MNLITVHEIKETKFADLHDFDVTADIGRGSNERIWFTYSPNDSAPLNFEIAAWWISNPDFPITPLPAPTLTELKATKLRELATLRYTKEISGVTINGTPIQTDRESTTILNGAVVSTILDPTITTNWKGPNNTEIQLDATSLQTLSMAVRNYVQSCFDRELELITLINAAADETELDAIDITIGWPSTVL